MSNAYNVHDVNTSGNCNNTNANNANRCLPDWLIPVLQGLSAGQATHKNIKQGDIFQAHAANNRLVIVCVDVYRLSNTMIKTYKEAITYDALYRSMQTCKKSVLWKDSVANYTLHAIKNISLLTEELNNGTYVQKEPYLFEVTSPKRREILSVPFRDRVYQRSLNDNILYPAMTKSFILDNCACQVGKGNQFARERLVKQLRRMIRKYGTDLYVVQIDIHSFYKSLKHEYVEGLFKTKLDQETFYHVQQILQKQYQGDAGYNPGSQMVQIAGISVLNNIDHYIKERLYVECYVHYMDDLILVVQTKEKAQQCKEEIAKLLVKINLEYNRKKTRIYPVKESIKFLGYKFLVTDSGKVIQLPLSEKIKNAKRKYRRMITKTYRDRKIELYKIEESYRDFRESISEGNSYYSLQKMDNYYLQQWKGAKEYEREVQFIADLRAKKKCRKRCKNKSRQRAQK